MMMTLPKAAKQPLKEKGLGKEEMHYCLDRA